MIHFISEQKLYSDKFNTTNNMKFVVNYLSELEEKIYVLDTETTGLDPHSCNLLLIQVGDADTQIVIDVRHPDLDWIFPYLSDESYVKILANAKFDYKQLYKHCNIQINNLYDVLLADRVIYNGKMTQIDESNFKREHAYGRFSLQGLAMKYLKESMQKDVRASFVGHEGDFTEAQVLYAASDIDIPYKLKPHLDELLTKLDLHKLNKLENLATIPFAEMELNGIQIDTEKWDEIYNSNKDKLADIQDELDRIINEDAELKLKFGIDKQLGLFGSHGRTCKVKWSSPKQKLQVLDVIGIDTWIIDKDSGDAKQSSDISVLTAYKDRHPIISKMIEYGETSKSVNAYGHKFLRHINSITGRIHTEIFPLKETGRTSSGNPNLQNISNKSDYRYCFVAGKGNVLITTDYSNMELRIIAEKSGEPALIEAFNAGEDVHSKMAMMIQKVVYDKDVVISKTENEHLRTESKTITFLVAYGGSEYKLAQNLDIEVEEALDLLNAYFKAFPRLKVFTRTLQNYGVKRGYIRTFKPYRRIRWFPQHKEYKYLAKLPDKSKSQFKRMMKLRGTIARASSNTPVQGSAADIMKLACYNMHEYFRKFNDKHISNDVDDPKRVRLLLQVHDESVVECPEEYAEEIAKNIAIIKEEAAVEIMNRIRMIAEPSINKFWKK